MTTPSPTNPNPKREGETLDMIRQWCEETFGPISTARIVERAGEEFDELRAEPENVTEAADVVICLSRFPGLWAEIERKMKINRGRRWRLMGDGTGYHIKDGSAASTAPALVPAASARPSPGDPVRADFQQRYAARIHERATNTAWTSLLPGGDAYSQGTQFYWLNLAGIASQEFKDLRSDAPSPSRHRQVRGEGWKLVPVEPTEEMQAAGWIDKEDVSPKEIYWAMLRAAPTSASESEEERA